MRTSAPILAVIAAALLVAPTCADDRTPPANKNVEESVKKIKELRKERIAVLKKQVDQLTALYKSGRVQYDEVTVATRLLSEAELEAAETDAERVELLKKLVDVLQRQEEYAAAQYQAARAAEVTVFKAKARRLEAEIHLEQAKIKAAKSGTAQPPK